MKVKLVNSKKEDKLISVSLKLPKKLMNQIETVVDRLKVEEQKARDKNKSDRLESISSKRPLPRLDQKLMSKQKLIELILTQALNDPGFTLEVDSSEL